VGSDVWLPTRDLPPFPYFDYRNRRRHGCDQRQCAGYHDRKRYEYFAFTGGGHPECRAPSTIGSAAAGGTVDVSTTLTVLNLFDGASTDALLRVGSDVGTGLLTINNGGTVNVTATSPTSDDAFLYISDTPFGTANSMLGTVILGDNPNTMTIETGGFLAVTAGKAGSSSNNDAQIAVGLEGPGTFLVNNSSVGITALGPGTSDSALLQIGGRGGLNNTSTAVGNVTVDNSTFVVDAQGGGSSIVTVGRGTNTTANPNPATAPENTLVIQNGAIFNNIATGSGSATFNVGRDGARGTATIDGTNTQLNVDDTINIGRDGGFGTMNVQNDATVNNNGNTTNIGVGAASSMGTLNVGSGGTFNEAGNVNVGTGDPLDPMDVGGVGTVNVTEDGTLNAQQLHVAASHGGSGETNITGADATANIINNAALGDATVRVGGNVGLGPNSGGTLRVNNGGTLNIQSGAAADDASLFISESLLGIGPSQQGTVIIGDDPSTGGFETGGTVSVTSAQDDAQVFVGLEGVGSLRVTDSVFDVTATGPGTSDSALFYAGGRAGGDLSNTATAVGDITITNSTVTIDAQGGGASIVSVGRGTDTSVNTDPMTAPENTLLIEAGSVFNNIATGTGNAAFNVGREGSRGTATIDGAGTTLNVEDTINIGRDGGFGIMNIQNDATVNNNATT
jgi:T5SS/PEP-CTERM-associated repeat protein